jgi:hypothetical protein
MSPEEKEKLERVLALAEDNNKILRKMYKSAFW